MKCLVERCIVVTAVFCAFFSVAEAVAQMGGGPPPFVACVADPQDGLTCDSATAGQACAAGMTCQSASNGCDCR